MCGIVGMASGSLSQKEVSMFEDLMIVSNLRGRTGSGIITIGKAPGEKDLHLHNIKVLGSGIQAINSSEFHKRAWTGTPSVLVGHTRFPTKGGTDIDAVHPHVYDKVVGVHNGTLQRVAQSYVLATESDSSLLYKHINEVGIEEALAQARGAYALVYVDIESQTLNFIRNNERTLYIAKLRWGNFGKTAMWASEYGFLSLILSRSGYKAEEYTIEALPANELWSLPIPLHGNIDFTVQKDVFSGLRDTQFRSMRSYEGGSAWYDNTFLKNGGASTGTRSSLVSLPQGPSPIGKETYVWRDGVLVAKSDPTKQVFLPPSSPSNERKGAEKVPALVGPTGSEGNVDEQRPETSAEIPDRSSEHHNVVPQDFLTLVKELTSKAEQEFDDDISDLYADSTLVDPDEDDAMFANIFDNANYGDADVDGLVETVKDHYVTYALADRILKHGCVYCGNGVTFRDHVAWVDKQDFLCEDCCSDGNALAEMRDHYPNSKIVQSWLEGKLRDAPPPPEGWFNVDGTFDGTVSLH